MGNGKQDDLIGTSWDDAWRRLLGFPLTGPGPASTAGDTEPRWETTERETGHAPDGPGWEPVGVSPVPNAYGRTSVVWRRRAPPSARRR
jgi:hypothetical protein